MPKVKIKAAKASQILVDREEYDALRTLPMQVDTLTAQNVQLLKHNRAMAAVNLDQLDRLTKAALRIDHLESALKRQEDRAGVLAARLEEKPADARSPSKETTP